MLRNGVPAAEKTVCDFAHLAFKAVGGERYFAFLSVGGVRLEIPQPERWKGKDGLEDRGNVAAVPKVGKASQAWSADGFKRLARM
jgi:hypothetical protein